MLKKKQFIWIQFLLLSFLSCSNNDNEIYRSTGEANINGEKIIFDESSGSGGTFNFEKSCQEGEFDVISLGFYLPNETKHLIFLHFTPSNGAERYELTSLGNNWISYTYFNEEYFQYPGDLDEYYTTRAECIEDGSVPINNGYIEITSIDNDRYIGNFEFSANLVDCGKTVTVTNGKFDAGQETDFYCDF
ncbi:DUF6252 family protein [Aestuariibaculum marinum]|uniref:Lipoprotein n=1 Tax=Aestuariibaculum marinum TaxID=2683592 RepID=A0A8J6PRK4_9FLAO|nr:DUF6252 family protein [Aestuariibaculum marinum]MBD0823474.1 hypothetical protein [Aestuariibaculum marinum]